VKAEFQDWKSSRVTKYLIAVKEAEYESLKEQWALGDFTRESADATNQLTAKVQGQVEELWNIIEDIKTLGSDIEVTDED
jgi:hypothetical protein